MKVLIIVLVLIAVGFAATIVYGVARTQPETSTTADGRSSGPPPTKDGKVDEDALENWQPPDLLAAFEGIGQKYSTGISLKPPTVTLAAGGDSVQRTVDANKKGDTDPRIAKLALVSGDFAQVTAKQPDKDDSGVCLCREGATLVFTEEVLCDSRWLAKRVAANVCRSGGDTGNLAFDPPGGQLVFQSKRAATVKLQ